MITTEPHLELQAAKPYVGIAASVPVAELPRELPELFAEVFSWLSQRGLEPHGPPLIRYLVTDMQRPLAIEVGVLVGSSDVEGDDRVKAGLVPAGRYATLVHTGDYAGLFDANAALLEWAKASSIEFETSFRGADEVWAGRFEFYLTDPAQEKNPEKWETEVAFLTRS